MSEGIIRVLPQVVVNQIAAGEVIENPSSVVKELLENAIDAKSLSIRVDLQRGGLDFICVSDDGVGMNRADLELCLKPHATSKIRSAEDLHRMTSMGFRGEALPSIGAIGRVVITSASRLSPLPLGRRIRMEGGKEYPLEEVARNPGTTVEVTDLFYSVPVRKAFQKSAARSLTDTIKMVNRIALAHPDIQIALYADGKEVFTAIPRKENSFHKKLKERIQVLLGKPFLEGLVPIRWQEGEVEIRGYIGAPHLARATRSGQFLFLNRRSIISPLVSRAIYEGYGTRLSSHTHPLFVIHLTLPLEWVDANVHPQKKEVRLQNEVEVKELIRRAMLEALGETSSFVALPQKELFARAPRSPSFKPLMELKVSEEKEDLLEPSFPLTTLDVDLPVIGLFASFLLLDGSKWTPSIAIPYLDPTEDKLLFVDLEGAKKRLVYEAFLARIEDRGEKQGLLVPIPLQCTPDESRCIQRHLSLLCAWGIGLRPFGEDSYLIEALDPQIDEKGIKELTLKLALELDTFGDEKELYQKKWERLALTACRYAHTHTKTWTLVEGRNLAIRLLSAQSPYYTPTGKPTMGCLSYDALKKLFH